ncbi:MAG: AbrB/MazE/SpoVT family DNA-binding domain-containing protein [Thermoplasmata archaeon]|nr:AbrB/MazE/SpoVT family DNA-binding domain-containing protein [Thermoplasmata archaeon]
MIVLKAKVGSRGQIVIPKPIRDMFHIHPDEKVSFRVENDEIKIRKEGGNKALERMLTRFDKKLPEPGEIDWGQLYYSQYEK